ncbi:hypothetical protein [Candidatus Uabimicrobium sp. HlEnr_7]|uniref:hypothetical protein n=1 Tax=Candidatus Uabimicrobium helgolandensis TaxID=3095367 RepID=UPI003558D81F
MKYIFFLVLFHTMLFSQVIESKTVLFEIVKFRNSQKIVPDKITLNNRTIQPSNKVIISPGKYRMIITKKGFATIDKQITIPVSKTSYKLTETMIENGINGFHVIRGDFDGEMPVEHFYVDGKPWDNRKNIPTGTHFISIRKEGYTSIERKIKVLPNDNYFFLFEEMISKSRQIEFNFLNTYTRKKIYPQQIYLNGLKHKNTQRYKPDTYTLVVKHPGYHNFRKQLIVKPQEKALSFHTELQTTPRKIMYTFLDSRSLKKINPDVLTINNKHFSHEKYYQPGKYKIVVEKRGYETKKIDINIRPSEKDYWIEDNLCKANLRTIELYISGDFPKGERVSCEVTTLNNKKIGKKKFAPGEYELYISQPGYIPLRKKILIEPGNGPFEIEEKLVTTKRKIEIKISYYIDPPTTLFAHKITVAPLSNPSQKREVWSGDMIKPDSYLLEITQDGYQKIEIKQHVWPDSRPYVIDQKLYPKSIPISFTLKHDVPPHKDSWFPYQVSIINKKTRVLGIDIYRQTIRPGLYEMRVHQKGYFSQTHEFKVVPGQKMVLLSAHLKACKRKITFAMKDKDQKTTNISQLINLKTRKFISDKDAFQPGQKLSLCAKFANYKTIYCKIKIYPGVEPQSLPAELVRLQSLLFSVAENNFVFDNIKYKYKFLVDGKEIESHHLHVKKQQKYNYTMMVSINAEKLRFYQGYFFTEKPISTLHYRLVLPHMDRISIPRLIEHLKLIEQSDPNQKTKRIDVLTKLVSRSTYRNMLKKCSKDNIQVLEEYVQSIVNSKKVLKRLQEIHRN